MIDGFASADECEWLIERGRRDLRRARVYRRDAAGHAEVDNRTNTESDFTIVNADLVLCLIRDRIAACIGTGVRYFEMTKLLNYQPGQFFGTSAAAPTASSRTRRWPSTAASTKACCA